MLSQTNNVIEIELFGQKLKLSERTARDVNALQSYAQKARTNSFDSVMQSAVIIRDGLKINLLPFEDDPPKWFDLKRKKRLRELKNLITVERLLSLPIRSIYELATEVLKLEGLEVEALKKKTTLTESAEREGLAVTLQTESSAISST